MIVTFDHGTDSTMKGNGIFIQIPDRIWNIVIMRIDDYLTMIAMARQMDLPDFFTRQASNIIHRFKAVVAGTDVDVIYVEQ